MHSPSSGIGAVKEINRNLVFFIPIYFHLFINARLKLALSLSVSNGKMAILRLSYKFWHIFLSKTNKVIRFYLRCRFYDIMLMIRF